MLFQASIRLLFVFFVTSLLQHQISYCQKGCSLYLYTSYYVVKNDINPKETEQEYRTFQYYKADDTTYRGMNNFLLRVDSAGMRYTYSVGKNMVPISCSLLVEYNHTASEMDFVKQVYMDSLPTLPSFKFIVKGDSIFKSEDNKKAKLMYLINKDTVNIQNFANFSFEYQKNVFYRKEEYPINPFGNPVPILIFKEFYRYCTNTISYRYHDMVPIHSISVSSDDLYYVEKLIAVYFFDE